MFKNKCIVNVYSSNNDKNYSRSELLHWINDTLSTNLKCIEQLKSGQYFCQLFDMIFRKVVDLNKIKSDSVHERHYINNYKILQSGFKKVGIIKDIPIMQLVSGSFKANYEFLKWFRKLYTANSSKECISLKSNNVKDEKPELIGKENETNGNKERIAKPISRHPFKSELLKPDIVKKQKPELAAEIIKTNDNKKALLISSLRQSLKGKFTSNIIKNQKHKPTGEVNKANDSKKQIFKSISRQSLKNIFLSSDIVKNQKSKLAEVTNKANDNIRKIPAPVSRQSFKGDVETNNIKETVPTSILRQFFEERLSMPDVVEKQKPELATEGYKTNDNKKTILPSILHQSQKYLKADVTRNQKPDLVLDVNETNSNIRAFPRLTWRNPSSGVLASKSYSQELKAISHTSDYKDASGDGKINAN
ncbi:uncharacterized protein LOC119671012 isoform X2 [Teleopsis dalmanni]|uniref:uncharacterized protein LOC119671012 isoform X2 n=1 Tax=Teleopsis dalmanni TaxID=139649 RepID=UPI0018CF4846|nr:uncharacterized protein LOC119671012 isoform X2 [Teleopsis dalmanni]